MCVPRTQRSAPFFTAWCAAEPGPQRTPFSSCAGLTRASIALRKNLSKKMDGRVKPGHDASVFVMAPALQRTASQVLRAALRPGHELPPLGRDLVERHVFVD